MKPIDYQQLGKEIRLEIVDMLDAAKRGHIGSTFSLIEILSVLFERILKFDGGRPDDPDRDRLILSKGHGCLALYPFLARAGYFDKAELLKFCLPGGILGGHPDHRLVPGIEASTGSLGHGLSVGIGMALSARIDNRKFRTFVIMGDGECNEGSVWEGALSAAKHGLDNFIAMVDYNKMQSYGFAKDVLSLEPFADKWSSFGFETREVDMDRPEELERLLLDLPFKAGKPNAVICHTIKGKGVSFAENQPSWHHKAKLTEEEIAAMRAELKGKGK